MNDNNCPSGRGCIIFLILLFIQFSTSIGTSNAAEDTIYPSRERGLSSGETMEKVPEGLTSGDWSKIQAQLRTARGGVETAVSKSKSIDCFTRGQGFSRVLETVR